MGGVSIKGLGKLLHELRQAGSSTSLYDANLVRFLKVRHLESLPMLHGGGDFQWELAHPCKLVALLIQESAELERLFIAAAARHRCDYNHRWKIIVGFDEFVPGNKLRLHNQRKCMNLSFTFLELECLSHDTAWFTPVCLRHSILERAQGGWGAIFRRFLHLLLLGDVGLSSSGLAVELGGQPFLLFAELAGVLADMDGHRMAWDAKGASGLRPCLLHPKVIKLGSGIAEMDGSFVEISCSDPDLFGRVRSSDIHDAQDLLARAHERVMAGTMTRERYKNLSKTSGLNFAPLGIFADVLLRREFDFVKVMTVDWVHCMLQDGVLTTETYLLITAASAVVSMRDLERYLKGDWCFPASSRAKSKVLWQVFDSARCPSQEKLKASASEMLGFRGNTRHRTCSCHFPSDHLVCCSSAHVFCLRFQSL